jgi:hypothetical protein
MARKPNTCKEGDLYPDPINGYVLIYHKGRYVRRNRLILSQKLGRELLSHECAHHIDGDRTNDDPDNLELMESGEHARHHSTGRHYSEKTRTKMRKAAAKRIELPGHRELLSARAKMQHSNGNLGRKTWTEEAIKRQAEKMKGFKPKVTEESRAKLRAAWTPERRETLRERIRRYNKNRKRGCHPLRSKT